MELVVDELRSSNLQCSPKNRLAWWLSYDINQMKRAQLEGIKRWKYFLLPLESESKLMKKNFNVLIQSCSTFPSSSLQTTISNILQMVVKCCASWGLCYKNLWVCSYGHNQISQCVLKKAIFLHSVFSTCQLTELLP